MGNLIKRYLLFYLAAGIFYGIYSFVLDIVLCKIDFGPNCRYDYPLSFIFYSITFLIYHFLIAFPLSMLYNSVINFRFRDVNRNILLRYLTAVLFGLIVGYSIERAGWSFYVGQYRPLKNIILFAVLALSVEILRTYVVRRRIKKDEGFISAG